MTEQSTYTSQDMDMDQLFTQEELSQMEEEIAQDVLNDGTAAQMAQAVAKVALTGESLEVLRQELGLTELSVNSSAGTAALSSMSRASARSDVSVKVDDASANIKTSAPHFGGSGLTVTLTIQFTVTINQNLKLVFEIGLEQQLKIVLKAGVDTVCEWLWGFIPYPDWVVTASIDIYSYTGLDIDMNATPDDGQVEVPDYVDMIYELINGGGGDEETAETLASLYKETMQNDSDWVELFKYRLMHEKKTLAKIVNFSMEVSFVVSGNVNVYVGVDFWYEIGRRYTFTMQILKGKTSNDTISLIPEKYELNVYAMGMLGLRAGLRLELAASLIHKKVAGVGVSAEAGAYIELYGYFAYELFYEEGGEHGSKAAGNLYVEVGISVEVGTEVEAIGGLLAWRPTIYSQQFPLWRAGNQYSVIGFHGDIDLLEFSYTDVYNVPQSVFTMDLLDMKTGEVIQSNYANIEYGDNFTIENTNDAILDGWRKNLVLIGSFVIPAIEWTYLLKAARPVEEMNRYEEGQLIITYSDPNLRLAFSTEPMQRVVNYKYDQVGGHGQHFQLNSEAEPWQLAFYDFPGKDIEYDLDVFKRYGYERLGWLDMNATYESDEAATAALVQDSELPHEIPQSSLYYMAVWEKIPLEYGVRHHYQNLDGSYPTDVETEYYNDGRIDETITTDATAGEPFAKAVEALDGFEKPFTRNVTVIKGERAVADFYYPRESYEATVNYNVNGVTIKTVTYRLKYEQPIPTPAMDGYTLASEWTDTTMQDGDMELNAEFTPRNDTLYAVEHYVQQADGSYALHSREEKRGITGAQPKFDLLSLDSSYDSDYDDTLTIAGDGSTVVKVRYTLKDLHTATFYNESGKTIGKAYYYAGDTIRVPQSVLDSKPGYRPVWPDDASFEGPNYDTTFTVESWTPALDTQYTVVHMEQDPDNPQNYTEVSREEMTGVTGDQVTVNLLTHDPKQFKEGDYDDSLTIAGDGSTVVEVTYDRCEHTLTYDLNADDATFTDGGSSQKTLTVLYGAALTPPGSADVQREGYGLVGWKSADGVDFTTGKTMPASDLTLLAQWQAGTQYKVVSTYQSPKQDGYSWSDGPKLTYSWPFDETETTYGVAAEGSGDIIKVTATPRAGYVTPDPVELDLSSSDPTVEFTYERITYDITVYDVSTGTPYKLYDVSGVRSGTDLTTVQLKWGYMPKMLYTDPQCKEPYNPDYAGGEHLDLYVSDWDGVVYPLKVWYDNYRSSADFDYWWDVLEARGVELSEVDPTSPTRTLYIKYGEGTTMPDADEVDIPISIRYISYSSGTYGEYVTRLSPGQEFDDVFAGNNWIDGTVYNELFHERGGDPETGAAQMIYNAGDFFEIGRDIELGIVNFQLANDIYLDNDDFIVISNYSIDCDVPITIDGNGKTLYNFTNTEGMGLFTSLAGGSMIHDLNINGFKVSGTQRYSPTDGLGLLVCDVLPSPDDSSTPGRITLRNISVTNSTLECVMEETTEEMYVGGLVGWCGSADLDSCSVDSTVTITATGENVPGVGAFVGYAQDGAEIDAECSNGTTLPDNVGATA